MWGSDNDSSLDPACPMAFLFCFLTEILCFRVLFKETVDHCGCGYKSVSQIISEYNKSQNIVGRTNLYRFFIYLLTIGGVYLVISPLTARLIWIPLVGYLLENAFLFCSLIVSIHLTTALYLMVVAFTWIQYRPVLSSFLLVLCGSLIGVMVIGKSLSL